MEQNMPKVWTALITPLNEKGEVCKDKLESLCLEQVKAGNGLLALGSTGEALNLTNQQKGDVWEVLKKVRQTADPKIMVGLPGFGLNETLEYARSIQDEVDAFLAPVPFYAKPGDKGQLEWFRAILDSVAVPVMIYNVPGRAAVSLSLEALAHVQKHPKCWAVKESSGSFTEFQRYKKAAPELVFYSGDDEQLGAFCAEGGLGVVSVLANAFPRLAHLIAERAVDQKLTEAQSAQWEEMSRLFFLASNPVPIKAFMAEEGTIATDMVCPPLSNRDLSESQKVRLMQARNLAVQLRENLLSDVSNIEQPKGERYDLFME